MGNFPLSIDERMVVFDMAVFDRMHLAAPLAPAWRPYAQALGPGIPSQSGHADRAGFILSADERAAPARFLEAGRPGAFQSSPCPRRRSGVARYRAAHLRPRRSRLLGRPPHLRAIRADARQCHDGLFDDGAHGAEPDLAGGLSARRTAGTFDCPSDRFRRNRAAPACFPPVLRCPVPVVAAPPSASGSSCCSTAPLTRQSSCGGPIIPCLQAMKWRTRCSINRRTLVCSNGSRERFRGAAGRYGPNHAPEPLAVRCLAKSRASALAVGCGRRGGQGSRTSGGPAARRRLVARLHHRGHSVSGARLGLPATFMATSGASPCWPATVIGN